MLSDEMQSSRYSTDSQSSGDDTIDGEAQSSGDDTIDDGGAKKERQVLVEKVLAGSATMTRETAARLDIDVLKTMLADQAERLQQMRSPVISRFVYEGDMYGRADAQKDINKIERLQYDEAFRDKFFTPDVQTDGRVISEVEQDIEELRQEIEEEKDECKIDENTILSAIMTETETGWATTIQTVATELKVRFPVKDATSAQEIYGITAYPEESKDIGKYLVLLHKEINDLLNPTKSMKDTTPQAVRRYIYLVTILYMVLNNKEFKEKTTEAFFMQNVLLANTYRRHVNDLLRKDNTKPQLLVQAMQLGTVAIANLAVLYKTKQAEQAAKDPKVLMPTATNWLATFYNAIASAASDTG
tara:strand:+ start:1217 stop:2290 length:1074 start_codon:yes stop_codon:yes gene_type:complete